MLLKGEFEWGYVGQDEVIFVSGQLHFFQNVAVFK